jgi:AraC family ethanolamine operon transcriptional activator
VLHEHFRDFDEFVASVQGVDSTMLLQNPARHSWEIRAAEISGNRVQLGRMGSGNIVEGQSWKDGYLLYLPLSGACAHATNGVPIEKGAFMILEPGSEFCLSIKLEHDWCSIFIPAHALDLQPGLEAPERDSEKMICRTTRPNVVLARQFRASVHDILTTASSYAAFESSMASTIAAASLVELGTTIIGGRQRSESSHRGRPKLPREEIIRRFNQLFAEREGEHVSLAELVEAAQVSERTLRAAFNERYGVSPVRYLQVRNLHRVHRALRKAEPDETNVADVLLRHGEWEFGRFATRYRRLFGELPSETLKAKHR